MTKEEEPTSFSDPCICGGFAVGMSNDRDVNQPHMLWCPQYLTKDAEYRRVLGVPSGVSNYDYLSKVREWRWSVRHALSNPPL